MKHYVISGLNKDEIVHPAEINIDGAYSCESMNDVEAYFKEMSSDDALEHSTESEKHDHWTVVLEDDSGERSVLYHLMLDEMHNMFKMIGPSHSCARECDPK